MKGSTHTSPSLVDRCIWQTTIDDEHYAIQLQELLSKWTQSDLIPLLEVELERFCEAGKTIRLDELVLDIGKIEFDNLERDLPSLIKSKLQNKLFYIVENSSTNVIKKTLGVITEGSGNRDLFNWIIKKGTAPWWYTSKSSVQDLIESSLIHRPEFVNEVIYEISRSNATRERVLWQWGEIGCKRIVDKLQPNHKDDICALIKEIHLINRKLRVINIDNAMFLGQLWKMAIEYLLCTQGVPFSIKDLSNYLFGKLSDNYDHNHDVLVHRFSEEAGSTSIKNVLSDSYLDNFTVQNYLKYPQLYLTNFPGDQEAYWKLFVSLMRERRTEGIIEDKLLPGKNPLKIQEVMSILSEDNNKKFVQLLRKVGREESVRRHLVAQLDDKHKVKLIQILEPNDHGFILVHAHRTKLVLIDEKKDKEIVWDIIFAYLLMDGGSYFNRVAFVKSTIFNVARERHLDYEYMLDILLGSVMENVGFNHRFELISILGDLKKQEANQEKNNKSKKVNYIDMLFGYLVNGILPIDMSEVDFNGLDFNQLLREKNSALIEMIDRALGASNSKSKGKVFDRILKICKQRQVEDLISELSPHKSNVLTNIIMQVQLWQKHLCFLNLSNADLHLNIFSMALEIAYLNRDNGENKERMVGQLLHTLFLSVNNPIATLIAEVEVCINKNINIILSGHDFLVLSNALNGLRSELPKGSSNLALSKPLVQEVDDWTLAKKISTVYRILQEQGAANSTDYNGKDILMIVLDNLSINESHKIFDGLLKNPSQFKLITNLIEYFNEPRINSWLKTLWPSATKEMTILVQEWQDKIIANKWWVGASSILRSKLEKIYWSCVIESRLNASRGVLNDSFNGISIDRHFGDKELKQLYLNLIHISCIELSMPIPKSIQPSNEIFNHIKNSKMDCTAKLHIDDTGTYLKNALFPEIFQSLLVNGRTPFWLSSRFSLPINRIISDLLHFHPDKFKVWAKSLLGNKEAMFRLNSAITISELLKAIAIDQAESNGVLLNIEALFLAILNCGIKQSPLYEAKANLVNSVLVKWIEDSWEDFSPRWPLQYLLSSNEIGGKELIDILWVNRYVMPKVFLNEIETIEHENSSKDTVSVESNGTKSVPEIDFYSDSIIHEVPEKQLEPLFINNAGLVILHSFFSMYFTKLKLLDEKSQDVFVNEMSQRKAVHCLQFLVSGSIETEEQHLVLNKLICGLPLSNPIERAVELEVEEVNIAESLVEAMINYWPAIGSSSIAGFRGNWLVRNGSLTELDDRWELVVERKSYDLLLQQAPFSYSIINYPWMNKPIYVTWPT